jgi:hypothetical protein
MIFSKFVQAISITLVFRQLLSRIISLSRNSKFIDEMRIKLEKSVWFGHYLAPTEKDAFIF